MKPNERAYSMRTIKQSVMDKQSKKSKDASEDGQNANPAELEESQDEPTSKKATKRKQSAVEGLMKKAGFTKHGSFRREQIKLDVLLAVMKRFGRVHVGMVSVMVVLFCNGHNRVINTE